jgi:ketosteroid isomerase-like protein
MRRHVGLSVACLLLAACSGGDAPADAAKSDPAPVSAGSPDVASTAPAAATPAAASAGAASRDVAASRALLDAWLTAMNQHDEAAAAALLAPDAQVFDPLLAKIYRSRSEAQREVIGMYLRAVPDGQWSLRGEPVVSVDGFSYEWTLAGTNLGNWTNYLRARGQKLDFKGATIVRLRDGKIAYQATYFDTNALGAQAGW